MHINQNNVQHKIVSVMLLHMPMYKTKYCPMT